jgi:CBS domain containing-hemolysin-like protein
MPDLVYIIIIILCILLQGFFSGSEIALITTSRLHIQGLASRNNKRAKIIQHFKEQPERFLSVTLIGTNLSEIVTTTIATSLFIKHFGFRSELYVTVILTPVILLFGEMIPKSIFREQANTLSLNLAYPLKLISFIFYPVSTFLRWITRSLMRFFNVGNVPFPSFTRDEILSVFKSSKSKHDETRMIERVLKFNDTKVREVMIPLIEVVAIESTAKVKEALQVFKKHPYSAFPVYKERVDNIIGIVKAFDLLNVENLDGVMTDYMLKPIYVQESLKAMEVLPKLQNLHMAIAVDEYGGAVGIVTVEDIMEEIVGEIEGEHKIKYLPVRVIGQRRFLVKGRTEIDRLNEMLGINLPEGEYETLAGFLITKLGRLPGSGEVYKYGNLAFTIRKASERTIEEVLIQITR